MDFVGTFVELIALAQQTNELTAHIILGAMKAVIKIYPSLALEASKRLSSDLLILFYRHNSDILICNVSTILLDYTRHNSSDLRRPVCKRSFLANLHTEHVLGYTRACLEKVYLFQHPFVR